MLLACSHTRIHERERRCREKLHGNSKSCEKSATTLHILFWVGTLSFHNVFSHTKKQRRLSTAKHSNFRPSAQRFPHTQNPVEQKAPSAHVAHLLSHIVTVTWQLRFSHHDCVSVVTSMLDTSTHSAKHFHVGSTDECM